MASINIKGTADFSEIKREAKNLQSTLESSFGKKGVSLFDEKDLQFLKTEARNIFNSMREQMVRLTQEAKNLDFVLASTMKGEQGNVEATKQRLENVRKIAELQKLMGTTQNAERRLSGGGLSLIQGGKSGGGFAREAGGLAADVGRSIPGLGELASVLTTSLKRIELPQKGGEEGEGLNYKMLGASVAMAGLTAVVGGAIFAFHRMTEAFGVFSATAPSQLTGAAVGIGSNLSPGERAASLQAGYSVQEAYQQRTDLARSFGTQRSSTEQGNILANTQNASRALGIGAGEISGIGNQLRATVGPQGASALTAQLLSKAMADGMDKSQASHFLAVTTGLLTEINKSGTLSNDAILGAIGSLTKNNSMSPELAAKTIRGMQSAVTGSTGENAVFFQQAAGLGGIGGGSLFGANLATQQGLFGIDPKQFLSTTGGNKQGLADLQKLGLVGNQYNQKFATGILGELGGMGYNQNSSQGRVQQASFLQQRFGASTISEGYQIENVLKKMASGQNLTTKEQQTFKDMGKTVDQKLQESANKAMNNLAGQLARVESGKSFAQFDLGSESTAIMNNLTKALTVLDTDIGKALSFMGLGGEGVKDSAVGALVGDKAHMAAAAKSGMGSEMGSINSAWNALKGVFEGHTTALNKIGSHLEEGNKDRKQIVKGASATKTVPTINRKSR